MLFRKKIFHITDFGVENAKINFFEEKCVYCAAFIKLKCRRFHTVLLDWQSTKHLKFGFCQLLYALLKNRNFRDFSESFENSSTCKNHCMHFILPEKDGLSPTRLNQPIL